MRAFDFAGPCFFHFPIPISSSNHRASCLALSHLLTFFPMRLPFPFLVRIRYFDTLTLFSQSTFRLPICRPAPLHFYFLFCVSSTYTHLARSLTFNGVCCVEIGIIVRREAGYGVRAVRGRCEGEVSLAYAGEGDQADMGIAEPDVA